MRTAATVAVAGLLFIGVIVGFTFVDEGRRDLRNGRDGHAHIITGVALLIIMGVGAISLFIA
jgi:hypothetical protein